MDKRKPPPPKSRPKGRKGQKRGRAGPTRRPETAARVPRAGRAAAHWLYGAHAVLEALANPRRRLRRLLLTAEAKRSLASRIDGISRPAKDLPRVEVAEREALEALLPAGAVHQGIALACEPLAQPTLGQLLEGLAARPQPAGPAVLVALDQVTDPQNVGAVLRSAAAFGAAGLVTTWRHAPPESGALAKAASGGFEHLPYVQVTNLARGLERLKADGYWLLGLAAEGELSLAAAEPGPRVALVLGAEGSGLRTLTRSLCDAIAHLPTRGPIGQLNVSNAAAVALYELCGRGGD